MVLAISGLLKFLMTRRLRCSRSYTMFMKRKNVFKSSVFAMHLFNVCAHDFIVGINVGIDNVNIVSGLHL